MTSTCYAYGKYGFYTAIFLTKNNNMRCFCGIPPLNKKKLVAESAPKLDDFPVMNSLNMNGHPISRVGQPLKKSMLLTLGYSSKDTNKTQYLHVYKGEPIPTEKCVIRKAFPSSYLYRSSPRSSGVNSYAVNVRKIVCAKIELHVVTE
jgi:hypothetical protein